MADELIKISQLSTLTGAGAQGVDIIPIVDTSVDTTKSINLTQLVSYLQGQGLGASVTNVNNTTTITGGTAGAYYEKRYQRSDAAPSAPTNTPYPPPGWSIAPISTNEVLWSTTALINAAGTALETGSSWSEPRRESAGAIVLFRAGPTQPADAYLQDGDIWYDINDNNKIYRRSSGAWVAAFTPFPNLDTNGNFAGFVRSTGTESYFAIVADNFQIVDPAAPGSRDPALVPFEIIGGRVYIKSASVGDLNAGKLTSGTINAAISLQGNRVVAVNMSNGSKFYNLDGYSLGYTTQTFPSVCFARLETGTAFPCPDGPDNPSGNLNWLSDQVAFYGWLRNDVPVAGGGFSNRRFGKTAMIFNYSFEGYCNGNNTNLNVMYQIDSNPPVQVQFPQADTMNGNTARLSQNGSIYLEDLEGDELIRFGYRAASNGSGEITYAQLTVTGYNV